MFTLGVLTISDGAYQGLREDTSGQAIQELLASPQYRVRRYEVVPDEMDTIRQRLTQWADQDALDLVMTTGGTGLGSRDVTPEATLAVLQREVPGIAEAVRFETYKKTPMAMLSRGVAGLRGRTLIINLPGSPRAVRECLEVLLPVLPHALETLRGEAEGHPTGH
ncbi:MAG: molybdenum cofactor biosynthesis protein B [Dehalococcoidia bacterium]